MTKFRNSLSSWHAPATLLWSQGRKREAIDSVLNIINRSKSPKPLDLIKQLSYYLFLIDDYSGASNFLAHMIQDYPAEVELLKNLAVCQSRSGRYSDALETLDKLILLNTNDALLYDTYTNCLSRLGDSERASLMGTKALMLKDQSQGLVKNLLELPSVTPSSFAKGKNKIISFSLWGDNPRYLRGALDNVIAIKEIYDGWTPRFYVDATVPSDLIEVLKEFGAEILMQPPDQANSVRLAWRFNVANDPSVGYFLVRDVDSVVSKRECSAVNAWLSTDKWFHVMRDWWTHTDLMLSGMWGGVAGILPNIQCLFDEYIPPTLETPNVDQWFLRDCIWQYVRSSCIVHDRYFSMDGSMPWPEPDPIGSFHVGQDVYSSSMEAQSLRLESWAMKIKSLQLAGNSVKVNQIQSQTNSPTQLRKINIATPAYGSTYAHVYLKTFFNLINQGFKRNIEFSHTHIDYADIVTARNYLISNFYFNKKSQSHLLFIDDDMGFDSELFFDMLSLDQDVVGVIYPKRDLSPASLLTQSKHPENKAVALATNFIGNPINKNSKGEFVEVSQCGTGILLISRECIRIMIEKCPDIVDANRFKKMPFADKFDKFITPFNKIELDDRELSEDFSFCYRWVKYCGGKIFANTHRNIQHVGQFVANTRYSDRW